MLTASRKPLTPPLSLLGPLCAYLRKNNTVTVTKPDLVLLQPFFGWVPVDRIKKTIDSTTQFARASVRLPMQKHFKSRFPAYNVHRWNESVATDTFFCDTPAHDDGIFDHAGTTMAQLYVGKTSSKMLLYWSNPVSQVLRAMAFKRTTRGRSNFGELMTAKIS
jgi:hypothetical protein